MPEFKRKSLEGVFALTPLCLKENQEIDYEGLRSNIELLEEKGVHGFIQFGCMGQMNAPSEEEFDKVCDLCVDVSKKKKIACVVSSTSTSTQESVRRARYAENAGADGSMLALPYAFPVTTEWAIEFYQTVDKSLKGELAILVYNYPPLNEFNITPAMWKDNLLKIPSLKALKESNPAVSHQDQILFTIADKVNFFSPSDPKFWHVSQLGAKGLIGILAWTCPRVTVKWYEECRKGHHMDPWTFDVYKAMVKAFQVILSPGMPPMASYEHGYLNALAEIGGGKAGPPRKPYGPLPPAAREKLEEGVRPLVEMEKALERKQKK